MVYEFLWFFVPYDFVSDFDSFWGMWAHCLWSCSPICIVFACSIITISFVKVNWWHLTYCDWKGDLSIDHLHICHLNKRIHLQSILIFTNLVWQHKVGVKWWSMRFMLCYICIQIGWYYKWTFIMPSILYHGQPSFKNYDLLLIPWICFPHYSNNFMQAHPHYIHGRLFNIRVS
jgi:hypothetical protein